MVIPGGMSTKQIRVNIDKATEFINVFVRTFSKAGGGFFPLQRLDNAHTAFLVMVNLVDLVNSLKQKKKKENIQQIKQCVLDFIFHNCTHYVSTQRIHIH